MRNVREAIEFLGHEILENLPEQYLFPDKEDKVFEVLWRGVFMTAPQILSK